MRLSRSAVAGLGNRLDQRADRRFMVSKGVRPCIGFPGHLAQRPSEHDGHERYDVGRLRGSPRAPKAWSLCRRGPAWEGTGYR